MAVNPGAVVAVTGANGFVGAHACQALLDGGYSVRAVVRDPAKCAFLGALAGAAGQLELVTGDLLTRGGYDAAFAGAAAVVHTAAVVEVFDATDAASKIVRPAVEGTANVVASARAAGVRRMVHISSVATVSSPFGVAHDHVYTEADWNGWSTVDNDAYGYAKTASERKLWAAVDKDVSPPPAPLDVVTLCPAVVLGPCFCKAHTKSSAALLREVAYGNAMHAYNATFVDARDVGLACVAALRATLDAAEPARFLVVGDEPPMSTLALAPIAQAELPQYRLAPAAAKMGPWTLWLLARLRLVSRFQEAMCTRTYAFSNARLKAALGVAPRPLADTVRDTIVSMVDGGWVKPRPSGKEAVPPV